MSDDRLDDEAPPSIPDLSDPAAAPAPEGEARAQAESDPGFDVDVDFEGDIPSDPGEPIDDVEVVEGAAVPPRRRPRIQTNPATPVARASAPPPPPDEATAARVEPAVPPAPPTPSVEPVPEPAPQAAARPPSQPPRPVSQPPRPVSQPPRPVSQPPRPIAAAPRPESEPPTEPYNSPPNAPSDEVGVAATSYPPPPPPSSAAEPPSEPADDEAPPPSLKPMRIIRVAGQGPQSTAKPEGAPKAPEPPKPQDAAAPPPSPPSATDEAKPAEAKPAEAKPAEAKPAEAKPAEAKPAEAKPAEAKPAEAKPAEAKPAEAVEAAPASNEELEETDISFPADEEDDASDELTEDDITPAAPGVADIPVEIDEGPAKAKADGGPPPPPPPRREAKPVTPPSALDIKEAKEAQRAKQRKAWWEELFGEDFGRANAKLKPVQITHEADFIEESLGVAKGGVVLDLACGAGYHAVELAKRGYGVVGYDLSLYQLAVAADVAQEAGQKLNLLQGDMREMAFEEMFDGIYCWNTSFGYFEEEKNVAVAQRVFRALRPGGMFLLDVANRDFVVDHQPSQTWFEGEGSVCMDDMNVDFITSRLRVKRSLIVDDGRTLECAYSIRLYSLHELGKVLHDVGFRVTEASGHPATPGVFFGASSPRIIILAQRP